jgi:hypothetical protein
MMLSKPSRARCLGAFRNHQVHHVVARSQSGISSFTLWAKDVVRTGSIHPPNPILQSLQKTTTRDNDDDDDGDGDVSGQESRNLKFENMLPHHLENATQTVIPQYKSDIAEWERSLTEKNAATIEEEELEQSSTPSKKSTRRLERRLDKIEVPIVQLRQVGRLFTELASPPDQWKHWQSAYSKLQRELQDLPWRESKIIYKALEEEAASLSMMPSDCRIDFQRQGAHIEDDNDNEDDASARDELQELQEELQLLKGRFAQNEDYTFASKAARLQTVSDLYNWIGKSNLQAQKLGYSTIFEMYTHSCKHMTTPEEVVTLFQEVTSFLKAHLPDLGATLDAEAGAFLPTKEKPPSDEQKAVWKARYMLKKTLRLHGVLKGIADFCETIFGVRIVQDKELKGWNQNVRVLRLYEVETETPLGTIYLDPFQDSYWRSDEAEDLVTSRLFTERRSQAATPVVVMALKIPPTWDDAPTPLSWDDTRDLLFQYGNALQMILSQAKKEHGVIVPADGATFLACVSILIVDAFFCFTMPEYSLTN